MEPKAFITTSWDDGHPLDLRVAELLAKHKLSGTFYVPECSEYGTMTTANLRELTRAFEVGAHTVNHVVLTQTTFRQAEMEIVESKRRLEDKTGVPCQLFCPPKGRFHRRHLKLISAAGFLGLRTAEWFSLAYPRPIAGLLQMPTTLQAYPHGVISLAQNSIKRAAFGHLWQFVLHGGNPDWTVLARSFLRSAVNHGGVFHLWGHSWELQKTNQWTRLEEVLRFMSGFLGEATAATNGQICLAALPPTPGPKKRLYAKRRSDLVHAA
jgi:peptidoglycan/xylan/chitin deacetylase (PgdA/CDA1 family)